MKYTQEDIINSLCLIQAGWKTEREGRLYKSAWECICNVARELQLKHELNELYKRQEGKNE